MTSAELPAYIRANVSRETAVDDVAELMAQHASDSGWIYLGGSGARQQIFRLNGHGSETLHCNIPERGFELTRE